MVNVQILSLSHSLSPSLFPSDLCPVLMIASHLYSCHFKMTRSLQQLYVEETPTVLYVICCHNYRSRGTKHLFPINRPGALPPPPPPIGSPDWVISIMTYTELSSKGHHLWVLESSMEPCHRQTCLSCTEAL